MKFIIFIMVVFFIPFYLHAKVLETSYLTTQIPDNWDCQLANKQWVCRIQQKGYDSRVVVSLTGKPTSPEESMDNFLSHLSTPKTITSKTGHSFVSKVVSSKKVLVNNTEWVESIHFEGEVPNYYTHYMVTINGGITIVLRFSAHEDIFETMKPYFTSIILNTRLKKLGPIAPLKKTPQGQPLRQASPPTASESGPDLPTAQKPKNFSKLILLSLILIAVVAIFFLYIRKKL